MNAFPKMLPLFIPKNRYVLILTFLCISCLHKPPNCTCCASCLLHRAGFGLFESKYIFLRGQNTNLEPLFCFIWCVMLPRLLFHALEGQLHRHGQCRLFCCWSLQIMTLTYHKSACVFATLPGKFWWIRFDGGHLSFKINLIFILVNSKIVVAL